MPVLKNGARIVFTASGGELTLADNISTKTKTSAYTLTTSDDCILADASAMKLTLTLPTVIGNDGLPFSITKIDDTTNIVTIAAYTGETILGDSSIELTEQYESVDLKASASNTMWFIN